MYAFLEAHLPWRQPSRSQHVREQGRGDGDTSKSVIERPVKAAASLLGGRQSRDDAQHTSAGGVRAGPSLRPALTPGYRGDGDVKSEAELPFPRAICKRP